MPEGPWPRAPRFSCFEGPRAFIPKTFLPVYVKLYIVPSSERNRPISSSVKRKDFFEIISFITSRTMKRELFFSIKQFPLDYNSTHVSQCLVCYVYNSMNNRATVTHNAKQRANNSTGHLTGVYAHLHKIFVSCDVSYTQYNQIYQSIYCSMRLHAHLICQ